MPTAPAAAPTGRLGVLAHPGFRRLWLANAAGGLGQQFAVLALGVTAVLVLHAGPGQLAAITALGRAGNLVLGLPTGVWVDRWQKKPVLVVADLVRAAAVLSVPVGYWTGRLGIGQLMVVAAVVGTAGVFFDTAHTSVLPVLVSREHVPEANARLQTSDTTMLVVGPGVAGQLLRVASGPVLYLVTGAMHLVSAALVAVLPVEEPVLRRGEREPFRASLGTGLRFVVRNPVLRSFLLTNSAVNLGAGVFMTVVPLYVLRELRIAPATYGLVVSVGATGGVLGSLLALRARRRFGEIRTKVLANAAIPLAFALVPSASLGWAPVAVPVGAAEFLFGLLVTVASVSSSGVRAKVTPHRLMGRVSAASRFVSLGAVPVGAVLAGVVAGSAGNDVALWTAVGLAALGSLLSVRSPLLGMRDLPTGLEAPAEPHRPVPDPA